MVEAKTMKIMPLDQAVKKFNDTGLVTIATRSDGVRLVMKDEGNFVTVGIDPGQGKLVSTDIQLPSKNFATKEEAFNFIKQLGNKKILLSQFNAGKDPN